MKRPWLGAVSGFLAGIAVLGLVFVVLGTYSNTDATDADVEAIRQTQKDTRATLNLIRSCTTPAGQCYEDGNKRTGEAIAAIVESQTSLHRETRRYAATAAACADRPGPQTTRQIARCIRKEIDP